MKNVYFIKGAINQKYKNGAAIYSDNVENYIKKSFQNTYVYEYKINFSKQSKLKRAINFLSTRPLMWNLVSESKQISKIKGEISLYRPDVIFIDHFRLAFLHDIIIKLIPKAKIILISHNLESKNYYSIIDFFKPINSIIIFLELLKVKKQEHRLFKKFFKVLCINSHEGKIINNIAKAKKSKLFYPKIDFKDILRLNDKEIRKKFDSNKIVIIGSFSYSAKKKNIKRFVEKVAPSIYKEFPDIKIQIIGSNITGDLENLKLPYLDFYSDVPETDIYYLDAFAAIVPEKAGGGYKLKLLESVKLSTPFIAEKNAIIGTNFDIIDSSLIVERVDDYAEAIRYLKSSIDTYKKVINSNKQNIIANNLCNEKKLIL